jgi:hypothetical protein
MWKGFILELHGEWFEFANALTECQLLFKSRHGDWDPAACDWE